MFWIKHKLLFGVGAGQSRDFWVEPEPIFFTRSRRPPKNLEREPGKNVSAPQHCRVVKYLVLKFVKVFSPRDSFTKLSTLFYHSSNLIGSKIHDLKHVCAAFKTFKLHGGIDTAESGSAVSLIPLSQVPQCHWYCWLAESGSAVSLTPRSQN